MAYAPVNIEALFVVSVKSMPAVVAPLYRAPFPFANNYAKLHTVCMARKGKIYVGFTCYFHIPVRWVVRQEYAKRNIFGAFNSIGQITILCKWGSTPVFYTYQCNFFTVFFQYAVFIQQHIKTRRFFKIYKVLQVLFFCFFAGPGYIVSVIVVAKYRVFAHCGFHL